jgi:UDP-N-acetylmuramate--alanine ligase
VHVTVGHDGANVGDVDLVAISTAIPARNPEVVAAGERGIPVVRRAEILAAIASTRRCLAVSGTHGKTTTSSMLALVLVEAGLHPSFIVGGELNEIGSGAVWADGEWFVVEADESDGTFVELPAEHVVVTNVEADHLDHYGSLDVIESTFERFLAQSPGPNVVCADDPIAARLGRASGALLYGTDPDADVRIVDPRSERAGATFRIIRHGEDLGSVALPVPGLHNMRNATAAIAAAMEVGAPFESCRVALARYGGVARRFQFRGSARGVTFVDDYAHNPGKVRAVLDAARGGGWRRVICVFQPHRYTRTAALWRDFADAFAEADALVLTDVYSAGEQPQPGVSGRLVLKAVLDAHPAQNVTYLPRRADLVAHVPRLARPGDVVLTLGAGDLTTAPDEWLAPRS